MHAVRFPPRTVSTDKVAFPAHHDHRWQSPYLQYESRRTSRTNAGHGMQCSSWNHVVQQNKKIETAQRIRWVPLSDSVLDPVGVLVLTRKAAVSCCRRLLSP